MNHEIPVGNKDLIHSGGNILSWKLFQGNFFSIHPKMCCMTTDLKHLVENFLFLEKPHENRFRVLYNYNGGPSTTRIDFLLQLDQKRSPAILEREEELRFTGCNNGIPFSSIKSHCEVLTK